MEFNNTQHKSSLCHLISHCVFRLVSGREHHVSDYLLAGIKGCRYKDQACFFVAYHDDCGWCGCSCNHGVYCGYYGEYGDCLSHTVGMLWGDWRVCVIETPRSSLDKRSFFRKSTLNGLYTPFGSPVSGGQNPSLPLRKAPPLISVFSPQGRRGKTPYSAIFAPPVPPLREGP